MKTADQSFEAQVWKELSRTDVSDHVDQIPATNKRPAVSYLSWHRAWSLVKRKFPASTYSHRSDIRHPDGTVEVEVDVVIAETTGGPSLFTNARLAVMNSYFAPISNPTAREVNDSRQRCLVKALAFAGLGLNLWDDSVIPVGKLDDPINDQQFMMLTQLIEASKTDEASFLKWADIEDLHDLPFERYGSAVALLEAKCRRIRQQEASDGDA
jgi:hypothetical protein